jgi:hypothetical protein
MTRATTAPANPLALVTEKAFLDQVLGAFRLHKWRAFHVHDSRRSVPGFPDVVAVHRGQHRVVWVELKTERGRLSDAQLAWGEALLAAGHEFYVWRPSSWPSAERVMRGERLCPTTTEEEGA